MGLFVETFLAASCWRGFCNQDYPKCRSAYTPSVAPSSRNQSLQGLCQRAGAAVTGLAWQQRVLSRCGGLQLAV